MKTGTDFLIAMQRTPDEKLISADPEKLAVKYGQKIEWVKYDLRFWLGRDRRKSK